MSESGMPLVREKEREFEWRQQDFDFLSALLHDKTGIVLTAKKKEMVYGRLVRRLRVLRLDSFEAYCRYLAGPDGETELGMALNAITTNTTNFFREIHHFEFLRDKILQPLRRQVDADAGHPVRIWSAGCSSGQEPYSIAMVMRRTLGGRTRNCKILATDLDTNMLDMAKAGYYEAERCADTIPKNLFKTYTRPSRRRTTRGHQEELREMSPDLKEIITFKELNLLHPWPMRGKFDAIFCRNVMIYFDRETQTNLVRRYAEYLKPNGILFVGHSESLLNVSDIYKCEGKTIYRVLT
ncbi:CheR family methyltransferase [Paremcibacter congregatus]|uniref:CheR family methyltransferase n=1 Tax=Paremcibacter congregatus TaxID=2043170 RepID=UPI0030ECA0E0|tara:strand:- start:8100 stop:8987 length:888 start_codon:yes stop_codon:yes gene_type:complete